MTELRKGPEAADPLEAIAMFVESPPGYDGVAAMARAFIEEFAMMGWPRDRVLRLFHDPRYAGTHAVLHQRGEEFVLGLIDEVFGPAPREVSHA